MPNNRNSGGRRHLGFLLLLLVLGLASNAHDAVPASGQWKPSKKIEFVVGTSPSGIFDQTARLLQTILREKKIVDVPIIVINKPGGAETISNTYLNQHKGDGHYLGITSGNVLSNHILGKNPITYRDLSPIAMLFSEATVIAIKADSPISSGQELVMKLRQDPQALTFAVGSTLGSVPHVAVSFIMKAAGGDIRKMTAVTYRSSGESIIALLGGHVDVIAGAVTLVGPHVKAGKLRLIGVASTQRLKGVFADVPTLREQGIDGVVINWRGIFGPKDLGAGQVAYWEEVSREATETEIWKKHQKENLWEDTFMRGNEFKSFLESEYAKTRAILDELGLAK